MKELFLNNKTKCASYRVSSIRGAISKRMELVWTKKANTNDNFELCTKRAYPLKEN